MNQEPLFFDDWRDAMRHVISVLGGAKVVGARMRPDMKPDHAARWVMDCLNSDRRENFSPDQLLQLLRLARDAGVHAGMAFIADECGYRKPEPLDPTDAADALRREFIDSTKRLSELAKRIESMEARASIRSVG